MNRFGGTLSPLHQILTPVHDKTEVGMLLYVLTQLWGQINPSGFQSPLLVKYYIVFMWIKYFEFEFEFEVLPFESRLHLGSFITYSVPFRTCLTPNKVQRLVSHLTHLNPIQVTSHLLPGLVNSISPQSMSWDLHLNTIEVSRVSPPSRSRYTSLTFIQIVILGLSRHPGHVLPLSQSRDWHRNLN